MSNKEINRDDLLKMRQQLTQQRLKMLKDQREKEESKENTFKPKMNKYSMRLAEERNKKL